MSQRNIYDHCDAPRKLERNYPNIHVKHPKTEKAIHGNHLCGKNHYIFKDKNQCVIGIVTF